MILLYFGPQNLDFSGDDLLKGLLFFSLLMLIVNVDTFRLHLMIV